MRPFENRQNQITMNTIVEQHGNSEFHLTFNKKMNTAR